MVVDIAGRFVSQRTEPRLASIATAITATSLMPTVPAPESLELRLDQSGVAGAVTVWRDTVPGIDQGPAAAASGFRRAWPVLPAGSVCGFRGTTALQSRIRRSVRRAHRIRRWLSRCWCCRKHRWDDLERAARDAAAADRSFSPESAAVRRRCLRRVDYIDQIVSGDVTLKMVNALHPLPGDDDRSADARTGPRTTRARWPGTATMRCWTACAFGMNAIVTAGAGATLAARRAGHAFVSVLVPAFDAALECGCAETPSPRQPCTQLAFRANPAARS